MNKYSLTPTLQLGTSEISKQCTQKETTAANQAKAAQRKMIAYKQATEADLAHIFGIYAAAISNMQALGLDQWDEIYPNHDILKHDILSGQMTIGLIDDRIALAFVLNEDCDAQYANGRWERTSSFRVIHRLCIDPALQNKGIGREVMLFIENDCRNRSIHAIRLDCFAKNAHATNLYSTLGYKIVGCADWRKGKFHLMEKEL